MGIEIIDPGAMPAIGCRCPNWGQTVNDKPRRIDGVVGGESGLLRPGSPQSVEFGWNDMKTCDFPCGALWTTCLGGGLR